VYDVVHTERPNTGRAARGVGGDPPTNRHYIIGPLPRAKGSTFGWCMAVRRRKLTYYRHMLSIDLRERTSH
jgi:hypothetical protein